MAVADGDPIVQMEKPGKLPSLVDPKSVPFRRHTDPPFRNEKVVGVALSEPPRMYPIGLLDSYEVVNDEAGGDPTSWRAARSRISPSCSTAARAAAR